MRERLQKILASAGFGSRRACELLISQGSVRVNGVVINELGSKADVGTDEIVVNDVPVRPMPKLYFLLNKPAGVVTTRADRHAARTVMDLLPTWASSLYPVGRLDVDTTGLVLLTNDGELANRMLHPRYNVWKTYRARVRGVVSEPDLNRLRRGVELDDGKTLPCYARCVSANVSRAESVIEVRIHEGRKRQVKRMLAAIGHPVLALERTMFGCLNLYKLRPGMWRQLEAKEIHALRRDCALD